MAKGGYQFLELFSFCHRKGLTSFYKDNGANFSGEKRYNEAQFRGVSFFFRVREKTFKLNVVLESKSLY